MVHLHLEVGLLLVATAAGSAFAQPSAGFGTLNPGQIVRVKTVGGSRFDTRLRGSAGDSVTVLFAGADVPFTAERVDSLWVRGRAIRTGAVVGGAVAAPMSFLLLWWTCDAVAEGTGCDEWGVVVGLSFAGAVGGALAGAGVGALIPKWHLRYARERDATISPMLAPGRVGVAVHF